MASQRQMAANKRNGAKSRGPRTQQGKARSRMNALRHGLAAKIMTAADGHASADDSFPDAIHHHLHHLRHVEVERIKALNEVNNLSRSHDLDALHAAVRRLAALDRYSQRAHSKLRKHMS